VSRFWIFTTVAIILGCSAWLLNATSETNASDAMAQSPLVVRRTIGHVTTAQAANELELGSGEITDYLRIVISTEGLQEPVKLKVALEFLSDKVGGKLPIVIESKAFSSGTGEDSTGPYEQDVSLPPVPKKMTLDTALRLMLSQVGKGQATYLVRQGQIEIVPASHATAKYLLAHRVMINFAGTSLKDALAEISELSGLSINIDPSVGDKKATPIKAQFRNASVRDVLVTATDLADLKFVVLQSSVYVTSATKARALAEEERERNTGRGTFSNSSVAPKKMELAD
jgi:hypothetical protein